jgi:methylthioribose-1-phosphate isomerase
MLVDDTEYQTIWLHGDDAGCVQIIDQRFLPHEFIIEDLRSLDDAIVAIRDMHVRGAPLIGATAAWGMYLAAREGAISDLHGLQKAGEALKQARPTAVNLAWAVDRVISDISAGDADRAETARSTAESICSEDVEICRQIGEHGLGLIEEIAFRKQSAAVNILTHCNAGWLATVDWGTATSPVYQAQRKGIDVHVWVDETRPRNQGASLTAWELGQQGVDHTVIVDNAGGHLMQNGDVDLVIVGTDRTAANGDVANKIGTYLKALAAVDNDIPFYVALPSPTIDWNLKSGQQIPIEQRTADEVSFIDGYLNNERARVRLTPLHSPAANPAFDVTPARLVSGLITERGICKASESGLLSMFPERLFGNV